MTRLVFILRTADTLTSHLLVVRIYASFHPTPQLLAQKRGRPRCHGNSISARGPRTSDPILAEGPGLRGRGRKVRKARKESRYRPWSSRGEFPTTPLREGGTSRDRVVHRRYTSFCTLPCGLDFLCFSGSFFPFLSFSPSSLFLLFRIRAWRFASYVQARNFR